MDTVTSNFKVKLLIGFGALVTILGFSVWLLGEATTVNDTAQLTVNSHAVFELPDEILTSAAVYKSEQPLRINTMNVASDKLTTVLGSLVGVPNSSQTFMLYSSLTLLFIFTLFLFFRIRRYPATVERYKIQLEQQILEKNNALISKNNELQHEIQEKKRVEEEIRISEAKYHQTLDVIMEGCQIIGFGWEYLYINNAAEIHNRRSKAEMVGKKYMDVWPDIETTVLFEKMKLSMEDRTPQSMESVVIYPDGKKSCFDFKIQPVIEGILILSVNISERKQAEEKLRKSAEMLIKTGNLANVGGWEIDMETMEVICSSQTCHIHELNSTEKLDVKSGINYYAPEAQPIITEALNNCMENGESWDLELPFITAKGRHIWVRVQGQAEFLDGKCVRIFGAIQDITDRKKAEEDIKRSEEQFRLISENVTDMIVVLDLQGKQIYNSPSYKSLFDSSELKEGTDFFKEIHIDDREKVRKVFQETVQTGIGSRVEYCLMPHSGIPCFVESQCSVIQDDTGNIAQVIVVSRDITEKKKLENQFLRMQRMESIGTLAGGIAHDLNNILSPILLSVTVLSRKLLDPQSQKMLSILEASTKRGSELIKQVLSFARGVEGEFTGVQTRHIIDEIGKIIIQTFPKSISLRINAAKNLPTVFADATQLHQVLMNLCVNARDAMPNGGKIEIEAETIVLDEQYVRMNIEAKLGHYVVITVRDQGTGMPPAILQRIFEPFFTTKEIGKGTGLGLSTVVTIIKSHNGFVNVYSEVGHGTTFKIYLPAQEGTQVLEPNEKMKYELSNGELILVVDDEESIREITRVTLEAHGYSVLTAADGTEAVSAYATHGSKIALVITDMMMPYMDGIATIRAIQKMNPKVKAIAVSGLKQDGDIVNQENVSFLHKPYTSEKLINVIGEQLQSN